MYPSPLTQRLIIFPKKGTLPNKRTIGMQVRKANDTADSATFANTATTDICPNIQNIIGSKNRFDITVIIAAIKHALKSFRVI